MPVPLEKVHGQVLSCGYGHTAVIINGALYTWGLSDYGVLGHGSRSSTSPKLLSGMGITLPEDQEVGGGAMGGGVNECIIVVLFKHLQLPGSYKHSVDDFYVDSYLITSFPPFTPSPFPPSSPQPLLAGPLVGGPAMAPIMNGRVLSSAVTDGSEPKVVTYLSQTRVLSVACGKNHMMAITDNGVSGHTHIHRR